MRGKVWGRCFIAETSSSCPAIQGHFLMFQCEDREVREDSGSLCGHRLWDWSLWRVEADQLQHAVSNYGGSVLDLCCSWPVIPDWGFWSCGESSRQDGGCCRQLSVQRQSPGESSSMPFLLSAALLIHLIAFARRPIAIVCFLPLLLCRPQSLLHTAVLGGNPL